jgi:hypothetical protein
MGDWDAEVAAWMAETATCGRCGDSLTRDPLILGTWLSDREGHGRGLCPDGQMHAGDEAAVTGQAR